MRMTIRMIRISPTMTNFPSPTSWSSRLTIELLQRISGSLGERLVTGSTDCTLKLHDFASMTPTTLRAFKSVDPSASKTLHEFGNTPIQPCRVQPIIWRNIPLCLGASTSKNHEQRWRGLSGIRKRGHVSEGHEQHKRACFRGHNWYMESC